MRINKIVLRPTRHSTRSDGARSIRRHGRVVHLSSPAVHTKLVLWMRQQEGYFSDDRGCFSSEKWSCPRETDALSFAVHTQLCCALIPKRPSYMKAPGGLTWRATA